MNKKIILFLILSGSISTGLFAQDHTQAALLTRDRMDKYETVKNMALGILSTGFNAGDGYHQVWARDLNTFIQHSCRVLPRDTVRSALLLFFRFQGFDGNMVDGYQEVPLNYEEDNYGVYRRYDMPGYVFHKNTVETDQETSLIQAIWKYIDETGDSTILDEEVNGMTVRARMDKMLDYLMKHRYNEEYGLLWGATTADWGDVQAKHKWGVKLDDLSTPAIDIYDNAMMLIALDNFIEMAGDTALTNKWITVYEEIRKNARKHLWDKERCRFIPHLYIRHPEFPGIDEKNIYYHGGTIVAIEAGLLTKQEVEKSLKMMLQNVEDAGAASIGLTIYPPYPDGSFENKGMGAYSYQNGGDWTWFGARIIPPLVKLGYMEEAITVLDPFIERAIKNEGFYEWYTRDNEPRGSGIFRGSAGVILSAIEAVID